MTGFLQNLIDGLGNGSTYALMAVGVSLIFGVMHLVNFAHGELLTVAAYMTYLLSRWDVSWWVIVPIAIATAVVTSMAVEVVAFRRVRGASPFTLLLTSFALEILSHALWKLFVGSERKLFDKPGWAFDTIELGAYRFEVWDLAAIGVAIVCLAGTAYILKNTLFGLAIRASAEDFDAARLMGVKANRVISGAFALAGLLAGIFAAMTLMRTGLAEPRMGANPLLKGVVAAIIGGLGSLQGAVVGGLALGVAEVYMRDWLPEDLKGLTDGMVFALIALLFVVRPQGLFNVQTAERV
jgi:branched-chain amino acid transport system permease protein